MITLLLSACSSESVEDTFTSIPSSESSDMTSEIKQDTEENLDKDKTVNTELPIEKIYLDAINKVRSVSQDCGNYGIRPAVKPLKWNDKLANAAREHSHDMAETEVFEHTGSGTEYDLTALFYDLDTGSNVAQRTNYNGYNSSYVGENIAAGYQNINDVISVWISSDGHCSNIMNAEYKDMGMSLVEKVGIKYTTYWTVNFGKE